MFSSRTEMLTAPQATLEWLADRARISDLLYSFAAALDTKNWQEYADNYADGGFIELPDPTSSSGAIFTLHKEHMIELLPKSLGRFRGTHHISTNHQIVLDGDEATSRSYLQAVHVRGGPTDHWIAGGWYDSRYRRLKTGWKFTRVKLHSVWVSGQVTEIRPE
jgi:SnoaL-like domain